MPRSFDRYCDSGFMEGKLDDQRDVEYGVPRFCVIPNVSAPKVGRIRTYGATVGTAVPAVPWRR